MLRSLVGSEMCIRDSIRHLVKMAHQLPGDWSGFGSGWLLTERTMQFQVAFGAMTLALAQHQYTPAYRELYRGAIEAYIEKLQHPDIWERWFLSSRSGTRGGILTDMQPGWMDPIAKDNICLLYTSDAADERSSVDLGG